MLVRCGTWKVKGKATWKGGVRASVRVGLKVRLSDPYPLTLQVEGSVTCVYCCALSASSTPSPRAVATAGVLQRASG